MNGDNLKKLIAWSWRYSKRNSKFIDSKDIAINIYRIEKQMIQWCVDIFCIGFIDFMLQGKSLLGYTNLFFPDEYKKNDKIVLKNFP